MIKRLDRVFGNNSMVKQTAQYIHAYKYFCIEPLQPENTVVYSQCNNSKIPFCQLIFKSQNN